MREERMIAVEAAETLKDGQMDPGMAMPGRSPAAVAPSGIRVMMRPIDTTDAALAVAWDDLARDPAEVNVFAERWFVRAAADNLPVSPGQMLEIWQTHGGHERLIALCPLRMDRRYGRLPVPHVTNWRHHHCFLGIPLIRAGEERAAWEAILRALDDGAWARGLFHLEGLIEGGPVHRALIDAAAALGRPCDTVHRIERAMLASDLSPQAYYEQTIRKKKRKEIKRLQSRLAELGHVETARFGPGDDLDLWAGQFLALERSGWKGRAGSALANTPGTERFFRDALSGARDAGRLELLRLAVDERPIAMLVNFLAAPGSFSFKIAFDEAFARFSPGVLIQLENLAILARNDIAWMDSCAVENHPMINSLWAERRPIIRVTIPLGGGRAAMTFRLCRTIERAAAAYRRSRARAPHVERQADED